MSTSGSEERYRAAYNQAIPQIVSEAQAAGKRVAYVDMSSLTTADLADALHPNDSGYQKMADAFHRGVRTADSAGSDDEAARRGAATAATTAWALRGNSRLAATLCDVCDDKGADPASSSGRIRVSTVEQHARRTPPP
ncbi:hypothetical protein SUDANB1_00832 [Streptomyces sp. enrichment culture]